MKIAINEDFKSDALVLTKKQDLEIAFFENHNKWKYVVWLAPGANNEARQEKTNSGDSSIYRDRMRFVSRPNDITSTGCYLSETTNKMQKNQGQAVWAKP